jgi:hypothetical protein
LYGLSFKTEENKAYSGKESQGRTQNRDTYDNRNRSKSDYDYNRRNTDNYEPRRQALSNDRQTNYVQERNSTPFSQIHIGIVFPQGDFGDGDVDKDAPFGDGVGFAATGFNIGYKY